MYIPFEQLPGEARIWIYQSDRTFNEKEREAIMKDAQEFMDQWTAHGNPLKCSVTIKHDRFIIFGADERFQSVSCCALDASAQFIRSLESKLACSLLDRAQIAFQDSANEGPIFTIPLHALQNEVAKGKIKRYTFVFINTITTKSELEKAWPVKVMGTWIDKKYISRPSFLSAAF